MTLLGGKAVVVTGAARGLGAAYAKALSVEGASVVVNDIDADGAAATVEGLEGMGGAAAFPGDVTSWKFASELVDYCVAKFGKIDGLVNNAGVFHPRSISDQDEFSLREQIGVNLIGQANCGIHALRRMMEQGSGSVVNTCSGAQAGSPFRGGYSAAMAGIAGLTSAWAQECAEHGVRVNAIAPIAATSAVSAHSSRFDALKTKGKLGDSFTALGAAMQSMTPEMNAPMVVYLLSERSEALTGQILRLAGHELMLMSGPTIATPVLSSEEWTAEKIDEAFSGPWRDALPRLGLMEARTEYLRKRG